MQPVRFVKTQDGLSLAWQRSGTGRPLVKAGAWLTHLEYDSESPVWSHWVRFLEGHFDYLRYDERGCGLSDRETGTLDVPTWTDDLERVIAAAEIPRPFVLLAMSQGAVAAFHYAARHPADVSHLVICGGYARGVYHRGDTEAVRLFNAVVEVFRMGWDQPNWAFREVVTRRFVPDGDHDRIRWFNDLCRRTTTPEIGARLLYARAGIDSTAILSQVSVPTLILHADGDIIAPIEEGRLLARCIPTARLAVLRTSNHILQENEPAWREFCTQVLAFVGVPDVDTTLTPRERDILAGICAAKSNKDIARQLGTSEKTIRNQITGLFAKLGVSTRQEAILKARPTGRP